MTKKTLSPSAYHTDRNLVSSVDDEDYGVFVQRGSSRGANQSALTEQKMTNVSLGVVHRVCIVLQTLNAHGLLVRVHDQPTHDCSSETAVVQYVWGYQRIQVDCMHHLHLTVMDEEAMLSNVP